MKRIPWSKKASALFFLAVLLCCLGALPVEAQNSACGTNSGPNCVTLTGTGANAAANTATSVAASARDTSDLPAPLGAGWSVTPVSTQGFMIGMAMGQGRNDGATRLYSTQVTGGNTLREFTFDSDAGTWTNTSNISLPFYSEKSLDLGAGRNDDTLRLYVGEFSQGGSAVEYTWTGDSWDRVSMPGTGQQLINLALGAGRGDDMQRLYFSTGSAPPNNAAREFSFSETWTEAPILSPLGGVSDGTFGIAVGDGRNDGVTRVYEGVFDANSFAWYVYEFSWNGAGWDAVQIASVFSQITGVAVGDGQNDGTNRIYVAARGSGVNEYTYSNGSWSLTNSIPVGTEIFGVSLGPGENDGVNRLYLPQINPGNLWEASFADGAWSVSNIGAPGGSLFNVRVGVGRDDQLPRVYAAGSSGLFEFEWNAGARKD